MTNLLSSLQRGDVEKEKREFSDAQAKRHATPHTQAPTRHSSIFSDNKQGTISVSKITSL